MSYLKCLVYCSISQKIRWISLECVARIFKVSEIFVDVAQRIHLITRRENIFALPVGLQISEIGGVLGVRDHPGADRHIAIFMRRAGAEQAGGFEQSTNFIGKGDRVTNVFKDIVGNDDVDRCVWKRHGVVDHDISVTRSIAQDDLVDVGCDDLAHMSLQGLRLAPVFAHVVLKPCAASRSEIEHNMLGAR